MKKVLFNNIIVKNIFHVANGTIISSILGLVNTALLISAIGMEQNGIIFLAQSYVDFFNTLCNFQSYEAVIKFLPNNMSKGNEKGKNFIQLAILLDVITAILASLISILLLNKVTKYLGWDDEVIYYAKILIPTILFTITGSFSGILRIYGKFKYISISKSSASVVTFLLYIIGYINNLSTIYYVFCILITKIIVMILDTIMTYITLKQNEMHKLNFKKIKIDKEFIKFTISTNICSTLDLPITHLVPIIINKYLGLAEISVYKILEKIGSIVSIAVGVINQVISPEISKKIAMNDILGALKVSHLLRKVVVIVGTIILGLVAITHKLWIGIFIENYEYYMFTVYLYFIYIIYTSSFSGQNPVFVFAGYVKYNIYILFTVNLLYIPLLILMTNNIGLNGLILSRIIQASSIFLTKALILRTHIKFNKNKEKIA